ncbi:MAG: Fic family protein, partial [Syntrophales bacterium LBB04]|nr:Fic family protein [Syntrophales bacterium LBB04]
KKAAGIGANFRAIHGLRHVYASMLASSGQVDMYTLQKLLTHKSPVMTKCYAHLRDSTLRDASNLAGRIINEAAKEKEQETETARHRRSKGMTTTSALKNIDALRASIDNHRPLDAHTLKQITEYFLIAMTYSSNALEGDSLTETETKIVIEDGITIGGKPVRDHLEALGHSEAYNLLFQLAKKQEITEANVRELHRLFCYRIDAKQAGKYRKKRVIITGADFIPPAPELIPGLMESFIAGLPGSRARHHPVEFAAIIYKELVTIHPFIDGNRRAARLLMNIALLQTGYPVAIIPPILRRDYLDTLNKTHKGTDGPFINFIAGVCYESSKEYLRLLQG